MKIVLQGEDAILLVPTPGMLSIESDDPEQQYSAFHMLASALAYCTFSVLYSWASNSKLDADGLHIRVSWSFAENPHRVGNMNMELHWPELPENRRAAAEHAAKLCAVHATLSHTVPITTTLQT